MLAVVDQFAEDIGVPCEESFTRLKDFLLKVRPNPELLSIEAFEEAAFSPDGILEYYRKAKFESDDVLWFYFCGHGGTDPEQGQFLNTTQGDLARSELRQVMESRKTRGILITTDACSTPAALRPRGPTPLETIVSEADHWKVIRSLIGNIEGTVDITAASGTGRAFASKDTSSNFSEALLSLLFSRFEWLDLDRDGDLDWFEGFSFLRSETRNYFSNLRNVYGSEAWKKSYSEDDQIPHAFSLGNKVRDVLKVRFPEKRVRLIQAFVSEYGSYSPLRLDEGLGLRVSLQLTMHHLSGKTITIRGKLLDQNRKAIGARARSGFANGQGELEFERSLKVEKDFLGFGPNTPLEILIPYEVVIGPKKVPNQDFQGVSQEERLKNRMHFQFLSVAVRESKDSAGELLFSATPKFGEWTPGLPKERELAKSRGPLIPPIPLGDDPNAPIVPPPLGPAPSPAPAPP